MDQVSDGLEHEAGLAGVAQLPDGSGDLREVRAAADAGSAPARLAVDVHAHRLRREIAAMAAAMDGLDALVFTGASASTSRRSGPRLRPDSAPWAWPIDPGRNQAAADDRDISSAPASVRTLVVAAREDLEIARQVRAVPGLAAGSPAAVHPKEAP
jgi:acetate kinase